MSTDDDYSTDVTDEPWELLQPVLLERTWRSGGPGRPPCDVRRMLNGILYLNKTGCPWRLVPKDFGHWSTIDGDFKRWRRDGVWARVMATLRQWERRYLGRQPEPSAGSMDSQSIKTATRRGRGHIDNAIPVGNGRVLSRAGNCRHAPRRGHSRSACTGRRGRWRHARAVRCGGKRRRVGDAGGPDRRCPGLPLPAPGRAVGSPRDRVRHA
jgi:transposase